MPKITSNFPKLHRHIRGTAFVKIEGRTIYFGPFDDPATRQRFDRFIGEWLANGRRLPAEATDSADAVILSVTDLVDRYRVHVEATQSAAHVEHIRTACRLMRRLYGDTPAADFGPMKLRAVRATMIAGDPHDDPPRRPWCRKYIADQVRRLRAMFRWAVSHELLPDAAYRRLTALEPLRRGEAVDRPPVQAVTRFQVRRAWRYMSRQVKALVLLQLLTGARAGELVRLRPKDIDTTGDVWCAKLVEHKTAHRGRERTIYFGPRARRVIAVFMTTDRPIDTPLFSPREADAERRRAGAKGKRRDKQQATAKKRHASSETPTPPQASVERWNMRAPSAAETSRHGLPSNSPTLPQQSSADVLVWKSPSACLVTAPLS